MLQGECHADAVACRLHLTLASLAFGKQARPPWDVVKQLMEYSSKRPGVGGLRLRAFRLLVWSPRHLVSAACALPAHGELVLQNLPEVVNQAGQLTLCLTVLAWLAPGFPAIACDTAADVGASSRQELGAAVPCNAWWAQMLEASQQSGAQKSMTAPLGPQLEDAGFDRVAYRHVLGEVWDAFRN